MTTAFTTRRRAEEFHELIEHAQVAGLADSRYAELAGVLAALRASEPVAPRASFAADLRTRLVLAAETVLSPDTPAQVVARRPTTRRTGRDKKIAAALGGFAIVTASGSMAVAAQTALPGDTLYPLKRALENAHAGVQTGDSKGATLLANASGRLDEVDQLTSSGDDAQAIAQTLQDFTDQASQASAVLLSDYQQSGHVSSLEALRRFTSESMAELTRLESLVPADARGSLVRASRVLSHIDAQARAACPGCTSAVSNLGALTLATHTVPTSLHTLVDDAAPQPAPSQDPTPVGRHETTPTQAPSTTPSTPPPASVEPGTDDTAPAAPTSAPTTEPDPLGINGDGGDTGGGGDDDDDGPLGHLPGVPGGGKGGLGVGSPDDLDTVVGDVSHALGGTVGTGH